MSNDYICSLCKSPAKPKLEYVGVVADCPNGCVESPLLVKEEVDGAVDLNECRVNVNRCNCGPCRVCGFAKHMAIHGPRAGEPPGSEPWGHQYEPRTPPYRPIDEREERDLADELAADEQADWTPAQRARHRVDNA